MYTPPTHSRRLQVDIDGDALTLSVISPDATPAAATTSDSSDAPTAATGAGTAADTTATGVASDEPARESEAKADSSSEASREGSRTVHRRERGGEFAERTLRMPDSANLEAVNAELVDGVLTVTVPKRDEAVPKRRQVPIA